MKQPAGPTWIDHAMNFNGLKEIPGTQHNPQILSWWKRMKIAIRDDETPWCGGFVGGVLAESGIDLAFNGAGARQYLKLPIALTKPAYGSVVIFWRGSRNGWQGHVGFVVGEDQRGNLMVLGGNQGNRVSIMPFSRDRVLGYRWPGKWPFPQRFKLPKYTSDGKLSTNEA
jgi:uncharacterized protein (TIGR02594 family)